MKIPARGGSVQPGEGGAVDPLLHREPLSTVGDALLEDSFVGRFRRYLVVNNAEAPAGALQRDRADVVVAGESSQAAHAGQGEPERPPAEETSSPQ